MKIKPIRLFRTVAVLLVVQLACLGSTTLSDPTSTPAPSATPTKTLRAVTVTPTRTATATLLPSSTPLPTRTPVPSLTPFPTQTFTPGVLGIGFSELPFRDDFTSALSGWPVESSEDWGYGYGSGNYQIYNNISCAEVCSSRQRAHVDVTIRVRTTKVSGPNDAYFGVTCRKTGPNYFSLTINGNGEYGIYKTTGGLSERLIGGFHGSINRGNTTNDLEATCSGVS